MVPKVRIQESGRDWTAVIIGSLVKGRPKYGKFFPYVEGEVRQ